MRNTWLLLKIQLSALFGLNKILHLKDKKERVMKLIGRILLSLCMVMVLPAFGAYAYFMGSGMQMLGQIHLFPALTLGMLCIMTLFSSVSLANGTIFAFKDYDQIMSLPVKPQEVAASRLMLGYIFTAMFDLMIMLPCGAVYAYLVRPAASIYPIFLLTMLAAPVVPMMIGCAVGVVIARLMASIKGGKYFQMLFTTAIALGFMSLGMNMEGLVANGAFGRFGVLLGELINRIYPLAGLYTMAVAELNWIAAAGFVALAVAVMWVMSLIVGKYMSRINTALATNRTRGKFRMRALNTSSPLAALYKKELRRYVSSVIYLFNTAFGIVLALAGIGVLAFKGADVLNLLMLELRIFGVDLSIVTYGIGYIGAFMVAAGCTTCCSISLEGKNLWLIQSLPVSGGDVLLSKMLVNLTVSVPTVLIVGIGAGLTLSLGVVEVLTVIAMGLAYALAIASIGLLVNLKSHNFDWTTDAVVVKQSAATGISMGIGMVLAIAPIVLTALYLDYAVLIYWLTTALLALVGIGLTALFIKKGDAFIRTL